MIQTSYRRLEILLKLIVKHRIGCGCAVESFKYHKVAGLLSTKLNFIYQCKNVPKVFRPGSGANYLDWVGIFYIILHQGDNIVVACLRTYWNMGLLYSPRQSVSQMGFVQFKDFGPPPLSLSKVCEIQNYVILII